MVEGCLAGISERKDAGETEAEKKEKGHYKVDMMIIQN